MGIARGSGFGVGAGARGAAFVVSLGATGGGALGGTAAGALAAAAGGGASRTPDAVSPGWSRLDRGITAHSP